MIIAMNTILCNCVKKPEKKIQDINGVWTRDPAISVRCSTNWAMKPLTLGAGFIVSGFIAQLVEHRTGIARSRIQTLLKSWIFFQASLRNCINCVHCHDNFFIFIITHLLPAWIGCRHVLSHRAEKRWAMKQALRSSSDVWCRVGLAQALFPCFWCARKLAKFSFPLLTNLIPDYCITPFCTCFIAQPLSALLSYVARMRVCNQAHANPVFPMYTVNGHLLHDRQ